VEDILFWLLLVVIVGIIVWDQLTMYERAAKRVNAARARSELFVPYEPPEPGLVALGPTRNNRTQRTH
jgi:hypothetical protein